MKLDGLEPFEIAVDEVVLDDLRDRLARTKWPENGPEAGWELGADPAYMRRLAQYWLNRYDWRGAEARLNRFPQYLAPVPLPGGGEIEIHLLIEQGSGANPRPLLLTHGWPGSFFEFLEIVEPLAHPERFGGEADDGFTLVIPSLPGYGFSAPPPRPLLPREVAGLWLALMRDRLGCPRFLAQGGDWGASVTAWLAHDAPQAVAAAHFNMVPLRPWLDPDAPLTDEEKAFLAATKAKLARETGYQAIQGTKPLTLAYGLSDSPIGLAAWLVEKFHGWSGGGAEPPFSFDQLLTNAMIYWATGSIHGSMWLYRAFFETGALALGQGERIGVTCGYCLPPHDLFARPPTSWLERLGPVGRRTDLAAGGHFTALQAGDDLRRDMQAFFARHGRF